MVDFFETALRWAWGTLLTAIVTAVLTMLLKHGKRWFRPVQKFIRTGRVSRPSARGGRAQPYQVQAGAAKTQRFSLAAILQALGQINQSRRSSAPTTTSDAGASNEAPLDLKF